MTSRSSGGPPPPGQGPGRYLPSPRRQVAVRLPASVPAANSGPTGQHRGVIDGSSSAYPSAAMLAAPGFPNPKIAEIQSRVEELVRRYDDAVAAVDQEGLNEDEDDTFDDKVARAPARWRVGDVLLATHRALARTSTHTERSIIAEFGDDPEVSAAIGTGAQKMGDAFTEAAEQAARRHQRLAHIQQAMHSVGWNGMACEDNDEDDVDDGKISPHIIRERQLKSTIDALHRENAAMAAQLQEALRVQQDACVASEQQSLELSKAQRTLRAQAEELRLLHESNEKAAETANALTTSWRDKFQASAKAAAAAEVRVQELEAKVRAQSEEIMKHTFVLQTKIQEMERFKESEAARSRAEAAAQAAALAEAEAEARRAKAKALERKRKTKATADGSNKDLQEMEDKLRELEGALLAAESSNRELDAENAELLKRMRELQARFGELRKSKFSPKEEGSQEQGAPVSTFALRLRENAPGVNSRKRQRGGLVIKLSSKPAPAATAFAKNEDDDLSSSESDAGDSDDEEMDEVERDERELNRAMQHVVTTVFPVLSPVESESALEESIAQYEDPARSPLREIQPNAVHVAAATSDGNMVSRSELDTLREAYGHEVDALKQQYVDGLQEYKRLVIEQYGRRQAIERERHHLEIEGLLRLIQTKFHAELSRRSERLKHAKESLKVLYNALREHTGPARGAEDHEEDFTQPFNSATPLKTLLRAAILAMSTSAKRNGRGRTQIEAIHEQLTKILPSPDTRTRAVAAAMTIHSALREDKPKNTVELLDASCQTDAIPVPRERKAEADPAEQRIAPESLEGYVLPGSPCYPSVCKVQPPKKQELVVMLHLVAGIPLSAGLVAELRRYLPNLPPGNFYVSTALRLALLHELVRFYAAVEFQSETLKPRATRVPHSDDQVQDGEFVIGSPRDTPFLRRKALEAIESESRQRNRRHLFTSGGVAILQTLTSTCPNSR
ncbi:hypothetical protein PRIC1_010406 [Phytophthora ramorum]